MIIASTFAAFVAATLSAGVTIYAYNKGKEAGYRKGLEEGFDKGFTKASAFTPPPFDKNTSLFDMLSLFAIASTLSGFDGSKKNTGNNKPDSVPVPQTPAEKDI
jgi:hypothetical protein